MADLEFKIGSEMIKGIVQEKLNVEVASALCNREELVKVVVSKALNIKVGTDGQVDKYGSSYSVSLIEWLCRTAIKDSAEKAIRAHFSEGGKGAALIQKSVEDALKSQTKSLAVDFVKSLTGLTADNYRLRAELKIESRS